MSENSALPWYHIAHLCISTTHNKCLPILRCPCIGAAAFRAIKGTTAILVIVSRWKTILETSFPVMWWWISPNPSSVSSAALQTLNNPPKVLLPFGPWDFFFSFSSQSAQILCWMRWAEAFVSCRARPRSSECTLIPLINICSRAGPYSMLMRAPDIRT